MHFWIQVDSVCALIYCLYRYSGSISICKIVSYRLPQYRCLISSCPLFVFDGRFYIPTWLVFADVLSFRKDYAFNFKLLKDLTCIIADYFPLNSNFRHWYSLTWIKTIKVNKKVDTSVQWLAIIIAKNFCYLLTYVVTKYGVDIDVAIVNIVY